MTLEQDVITFGKYKGQKLTKILRDRSYCKWLLDQPWMAESYPWFYNKIQEYDPKVFFLPQGNTMEELDQMLVDGKSFLQVYPYFNLTFIDDLQIPLDEPDRSCYRYYLQLIDAIRSQIYVRMENEHANIYDIRAPSGWLGEMERDLGIPRDVFKEFLAAYELPNITTIVSHVKTHGGIAYNGHISFNIAKHRSVEQENWWREILVGIYGDDLGSQYKYENCIFDFVYIPGEIVYECKLGFKDFNQTQYSKYRKVTTNYRMVYLIGRETIVHCKEKIIYTTNEDTVSDYISTIAQKPTITYLDLILLQGEIIVRPSLLPTDFKIE